jgi:hypothetical protein
MDKPGPEFKASSGEKFTEGGSYDWDTQAMIVRDFGPASAWQAGSLLTHEVGHHVHRKAIADSLIEQLQVKVNRPEMYDAAGKLKSEFAQVFRKEAPLTTALKGFKKAYARGDGITEYSKAWKGDDSETVAEYAKLRWERGAAQANTVASRTKAGQALSDSLNTLFNLMESGKYRSAGGETATIAGAEVRQEKAGGPRLEMKFFSGEGVEVEPSEADYAVALEFDDEGVLVKSTWYWPEKGSAPLLGERDRLNPYHEPAGSPIGGQFAKAPGGVEGFSPPQESVMSAEAAARASIKRYAEDVEITYEEAEARILAEMQEAAKAPISIRAGLKGAEGIVADERFKNQFETGTSGGAFAPDFRRECEYNGLGVPVGAGADARPIYGYLAYGTNYATQYGMVEFRLKESVKNRATMTADDSLAGFDQRYLVGTPVNKPGLGGADDNADRIIHKEIDYYEVQIKGGIGLKDVQQVIFHQRAFWGPGMLQPEFQKLEAKLRSKGIEVSYDKATF